jgi:hypothetical protein
MAERGPRMNPETKRKVLKALGIGAVALLGLAIIF